MNLPDALKNVSHRTQVVCVFGVLIVIAVVGSILQSGSGSGYTELSRQSTAAPNAHQAPGEPALPGSSTPAPGPADPHSPELSTSGKPGPGEANEPEATTFRSPVRCTESGAPEVGSLPGDDARGSKKWVTVGSLDGSCDGTSKTFALKGVDTRLVWRSDAAPFAAFVLSKEGLDATAGYADADCVGACSESQALTLPAGSYSLRVQADGGPWQVRVQEYR